MNDQQWNTLLSVVRGETARPLPTAFIIDSPWLPKWAGHTILDHFTDDGMFFAPRDVLAQGTPEGVKRALARMLDALEDKSRIIVSCGGGMPPDVPTANIEAMISSVEELTRWVVGTPGRQSYSFPRPGQDNFWLAGNSARSAGLVLDSS
jgi:hypothetical protein